jgi:NAD(P)-dependent dehydrogenase (short-subunit alcohol dehydrogenase family)
VSGGTAGVVAPVLLDLVRRTGGDFYLLGRHPLPKPDDPNLSRLTSDRSGLKRDLLAAIAGEGGSATPARAEQRLASLERAAAALRAIEDLRAAGARVEYLACDITSADEVGAAVAKVLQLAGRVDVLLHAAGIESSRRFEKKTQEEIEQTVAVKASGFFYLYQALRRSHALPSRILAFSSIAGRFGNSGQTDYSAANDLLCRLVSALRRQHPDIKAQVIDWGPWSDVGMASRGHIPALMARAGIEMLNPRAAAQCVYRELTAAPAGEVLISGSLGALQRSESDAGMLDVDKANAALRAGGDPIHVMLSRITGYTPQEGITLEVVLDPAQEPFLKDHARDGVPLLPGVMGIEGFSVAAQNIASVVGSGLEGGFAIDHLEEIRFLAPFKFYGNKPRRAIWKARALREGADLVVSVSLQSTVERPGRPAEAMQHFAGRVYLKPVSSEEELPRVAPPEWNGAYTVGANDIYRLYFHGPAFQVLEGAQRCGDRVLGKMADSLPPLTSSSAPLITSPMFLELALQTAGIWEAGATGVLALPTSIGRMNLHRPAPAKGQIYADVLPTTSADGGLSFNARVVDAEGNLYLELEDYRTAPLPFSVEEELVQPLLRLVN